MASRDGTTGLPAVNSLRAPCLCGGPTVPLDVFARRRRVTSLLDVFGRSRSSGGGVRAHRRPCASARRATRRRERAWSRTERVCARLAETPTPRYAWPPLGRERCRAPRHTALPRAGDTADPAPGGRAWWRCGRRATRRAPRGSRLCRKARPYARPLRWVGATASRICEDGHVI